MKAGATPKEKEALRILAGCDQGATETSLAFMGVKRRVLDELVRAGKLHTWVQHLHHPRIDVRWYGLGRD